VTTPLEEFFERVGTNWSFDPLHDPNWQPSREDYLALRNAALAEVERLLEGYRYILGFDVAGYDGHLRNYEVAAKFIHYETGEALPDGSSISQIEEN
jgi:hypothetical protein